MIKVVESSNLELFITLKIASNTKRKNQSQKSNTYIEKRRKNNEAAKRSREKKRKREGLLEQKVKDLKTENEKLIG